MSTIYAADYSATTQTVAAAIAASIDDDATTTIVAGDCYDAIADELLIECEGESHDGAYYVAAARAEFWGQNLDGQEWRVCVTV